MADQKRERLRDSAIPEKYSELEEAILLHLFDHPNWEVNTYGLASALTPGAQSREEMQQAFEAAQYAVETLVAARLVKGERTLAADQAVYFQKLLLTDKGEAEAILQKRRKRL